MTANIRPKCLIAASPSFDRLNPPARKTYRGARDRHLDLAAGGAQELVELGADAAEQGQAVVLGEGVEEVLDRLVGGAGALLELGDDGGLVGGAQGRGPEDGRQLGVLLDEAAQPAEGSGRGVQGRGLDCGSVLSAGRAPKWRRMLAHACSTSFTDASLHPSSISYPN